MSGRARRIIESLKLGWTWCYLLKCTGGCLLIDTYYPWYYAKFEKKLANRGIAASEIKYLFLTHHHRDRAGFAGELVRHTGCRVIAHRNAVSPLKQGKYEGTAKPVNRRIQIVMTSYSLFHRGEWDFPPLRLADSDVVIEGDNNEFIKEIGIDGGYIAYARSYKYKRFYLNFTF